MPSNNIKAGFYLKARSCGNVFMSIQSLYFDVSILYIYIILSFSFFKTLKNSNSFSQDNKKVCIEILFLAIYKKKITSCAASKTPIRFKYTAGTLLMIEY